MRNSNLTIVTFLAGVAVGANWPKIKKQINPLLKQLEGGTDFTSTSILRFFAEQKEKIEDTIAEAKIKKTGKVKKVKPKRKPLARGQRPGGKKAKKRKTKRSKKT